MSPQVAQYWNAFRAETGRGEAEPFDVFKIGNSAQSADAGLALVMSGQKTATSCLPEEFADSRPPQAGDLSVITNGDDEPGGVVETTEVEIKPFDAADDEFARAYGEWDHTLATWRKNNAEYYLTVCAQMGLDWHEKRDLVFERFRVVHRNELIGSAASA